MIETGNPLENPIAERVNGTLKNEYLVHRAVYSLAHAELVLEQAVYLYNYKRPHLSCDMLVPDQAHRGKKAKAEMEESLFSKAGGGYGR